MSAIRGGATSTQSSTATIDRCRRTPPSRPIVLVILAIGMMSASGTPSSDDQQTDDAFVEEIVSQMIGKGGVFSPENLRKKGMPALRAIMDRVFPETAIVQPPNDKDVVELMEKLGDDNWQVREQATRKLMKLGRSHPAVVKNALQNAGPEVGLRIKRILESWETEDAKLWGDASGFCGALRNYVEPMKDKESLTEIAARVVRALQLRLDRTPKKRAIDILLMPISSSHDDSVHNLLVPLVQHKDPTVPMFVIRSIAGRPGNSYVAPIHMAALRSGRKNLIKCALNSSPSPIWDNANLPVFEDIYRKIFDGSDPLLNFEDDPQFMMGAAFTAARDFHIEKARNYLLERIGSKDPSTAKDAINSLGDTYYYRDPICPELQDALKHHLTSKDPAFRRCALNTLGAYRGPTVLPILLASLKDKKEAVWKMASACIVRQHGFYPANESPVPQILQMAALEEQEECVRERLTYILKFITETPDQYFPWQ